MAIHTSAKSIFTIEQFLKDYYAVECTKKMTHGQLKEFMLEKKMSLPERSTFQVIKKEDIIKNNIVFVRDKKGNVIPYKDPRTSLERLLLDLRLYSDKEKLQKIRKKILNEIGYMLDEEGVIIEQAEDPYRFYEEEVNNKKNRQKTKMQHGSRGLIQK